MFVVEIKFLRYAPPPRPANGNAHEFRREADEQSQTSAQKGMICHHSRENGTKRERELFQRLKKVSGASAQVRGLRTTQRNGASGIWVAWRAAASTWTKTLMNRNKNTNHVWSSNCYNLFVMKLSSIASRGKNKNNWKMVKQFDCWAANTSLINNRWIRIIFQQASPAICLITDDWS